MLHRWGCSKAKCQQHQLLPLLQLQSDCKLSQLADVLRDFSWQIERLAGLTAQQGPAAAASGGQLAQQV